MADERCGTLTTMEPEISCFGPLITFTAIRLRDGRLFVPDVWRVRYAAVDEVMRHTEKFHYDSKLDGWVEGPYLN